MKKRKRYAFCILTGGVLRMCYLISFGMERLRQEFIFLNLYEFLNSPLYHGGSGYYFDVWLAHIGANNSVTQVT